MSASDGRARLGAARRASMRGDAGLDRVVALMTAAAAGRVRTESPDLV